MTLRTKIPGITSQTSSDRNRSDSFPTSPLPIKNSHSLSTDILAMRTANELNIHVSHCCLMRSEKCKETREGSKCLSSHRVRLALGGPERLLHEAAGEGEVVNQTTTFTVPFGSSYRYTSAATSLSLPLVVFTFRRAATSGRIGPIRLSTQHPHHLSANIALAAVYSKHIFLVMLR